MSDKDKIEPIVPDDPTTEAPPNDKKPSSGRRQFVTGVATALGAGVILNATGSSAASEQSAAEVRSRILSRIQSDLQKSQNDKLFGYDKPDSATPHGRYIKPDKPPADELQQPGQT